MISVKGKYLSSDQSSFDLRRYWKALDFDECALHFTHTSFRECERQLFLCTHVPHYVFFLKHKVRILPILLDGWHHLHLEIITSWLVSNYSCSQVEGSTWRIKCHAHGCINITLNRAYPFASQK